MTTTEPTPQEWRDALDRSNRVRGALTWPDLTKQQAAALQAEIGELAAAVAQMGLQYATAMKAKRRAEQERDGITAMAAVRAEAHVEAVRLLEYALHLRMHGENAPGGEKTWAHFELEVEHFLRWGQRRPAQEVRCVVASCPDFGDPSFGEGTCPAEHAPHGGYSPVRVPENTGKHPVESAETAAKQDTRSLPIRYGHCPGGAGCLHGDAR